jgi:hypothetical protein
LRNRPTLSYSQPDAANLKLSKSKPIETQRETEKTTEYGWDKGPVIKRKNRTLICETRRP